MVKQIIKEALEKNPIGVKEAVEEELMERLRLALEAKKKSHKEKDLEEARGRGVKVDKQKYSWGTLMTVKDGMSITYPLHQHEQEKIASLDDGEEIKFKDETGSLVIAKRKGNMIHLQHSGQREKTAVQRKHFVSESFDLEESVKDLGRGIRVNVDSDKSMVIGDKTAPGGSQMVVLEKDAVKKMVSVLSSGKSTKTDLGRGVKMSVDSDGDVTISDSNTPVGRQMVVLSAKQVQDILKLVK